MRLDWNMSAVTKCPKQSASDVLGGNDRRIGSSTEGSAAAGPSAPSMPPEASRDRESTVMTFSGGSPPRGRAYKIDADRCTLGHDLRDTASSYLTATGRRQCLRCRITYIQFWHTRLQPQLSARDAMARAEEKVRRTAEREQRRQAQRAGRELLREARAQAKGMAS